MNKKVLAIGLAAIFAFSGAFFVNDHVQAQPTLEQVQQEQQEVRVKLSKEEAKIADILYEIKEVSDEITRLEIALEENEKQMKANEEKAEELNKEIAEIEARIEKRNAILKERIASYQANGGPINVLEVIFDVKYFSQFISQISAVSTITQADLDMIKEQEADKALVEEKVKEVEEVIQELEEIQETMQAQKDELEDKKKELKDKEKKVEKEIAKLESKSAELSRLESEIRASMLAATLVENNNNNSSNNSNNNGNNTNNNNSGNSDGNNNATNNTNNSSNDRRQSQAVSYSGAGTSAIAAGKQFIGRSKYGYGAQNPAAGVFDCSGFVQWAYAQEGISLPRSAKAMSQVGKKVSLSEAKPGDLVFFRNGGHVGIYLGGGKFLGSQTSTGVAIADMNSGYWKQHFDGNVRRVK